MHGNRPLFRARNTRKASATLSWRGSHLPVLKPSVWPKEENNTLMDSSLFFVFYLQFSFTVEIIHGL